MLPMIYEINKEYKILAQGSYKGVKYFIVNIGGNHPCAYVQSDVDYREKEGCPAHWGFTFYNNLCQIRNRQPNSEKIDDLLLKYLGWDYGHFGDYTTYWQEGKKWTTEEILENVKEVIEWMLKL